MRLMKKVILILTALLLVLPRHASAADTLNETLQKGLFEEEGNHNLDAAIKAYQAVLQQSDEQRKMAATAIFRLGSVIASWAGPMRPAPSMSASCRTFQLRLSWPR